MLENLKTHKVLKAQIALFAPYLQSGVSELLSNTENELWLYQLNGTRQKVHDPTFSKEFLLRFCEQLANYRDLPFSEQAPTLNCSIPFTRYRVSANHFSITTNNQISLNIRVPSLQKFPLEAFSLASTCPFSHTDLKSMAQEKHNILISGATASGKTSLLNALLEFIPKEERVVSVEDSQELDLSGFENSVGLLVGKIEQTPFTYENALNMAMRMRPDRLMVGEIDTRNALLFLRFGNTGHKGMMSTLHANSVEQVLEAIALNIEMGHKAKFDLNIVKRYFKSAVDVVIQVCKIQEQRHITQVLFSKDL
ncbi:Type IV secretion system ATPase TrbB [Helicobacter sp. NHP19-003]|uniref:Type IV secretion system ATPase TrbB n=1 Tax=Helicobacter gastrocanis TaxID=2849641 RepID=A0ABN6I411_9HELI|nr:type II/IV secretion system ATPase subunit [Helicobacter sp. NHP19-003]BCZ17399.1 Type IV secretion system ATPase TrbB [Helicobacter sp. NHP19-003]